MEIPYFQNLDRMGVNWVKSNLDIGEVFSRALLSQIHLQDGSVYIALAEPEHKEAIAKHIALDQGVVNRADADSKVPLRMLFDKLLQLEKKWGSLVIAVEDNLIYADDPIQNLPELPRLRVDNRYIYICSTTDLHNDAKLGYLLGQSSGYPLNAFIVLQQDILTPTSLSTSKAEELIAQMHDSVIGIINTAYDCETYSIWIKK